ncbi:Gfo/Idh/MocA family oxidoreductase [Candidatus Aerophobetes bacterium]|nr:Gfo/Idh/MocA family oxidoreductase [Candidatus Aerophobetes bacterium]
MVRISMLGSGFTPSFFMAALKTIPGQEVKVVYSPTEAHVRRFAEKWGIPEWTTDMEKAIRRNDIDLVVVGLPNFVHKQAAIMAAEAGKNVVCTKPLARNAEEARHMLEAVKKAGVIHGYLETDVFCPSVVKAEEVIRKGGIGDVFWIRSREAHYGPHGAWFWDPELAGGGCLMDMGCHCIENARYFLGKNVKPVEVMAWGDTIVHPVDCEDNAVLLVRFEGKQIAQVEVSWSSRGGLDLRNEIYGTQGSIFTDVTRSTPIQVFSLAGSGYVVEKAEADKGWVFPVPNEAVSYGFVDMFRYFVDCIESGKTPRETFEDGYIVNLIIDAGYRSMKSGRWEKVGV